MHTFIAVVHIPDEIYRERRFDSFKEVNGDHLVHWTVKELNKFMPGSRNWRRYDSNLGIVAVQYLTTHMARIIVRQTDENTARDQLSSFLWTMKPKEPRKKYTYKTAA